MIPVLEYKRQAHKLLYRWTNCIKGFNIPVKIIAGKQKWIKPTDKWQSISDEGGELKVDRNFYVNVKKVG